MLNNNPCEKTAKKATELKKEESTDTCVMNENAFWQRCLLFVSKSC